MVTLRRAHVKGRTISVASETLCRGKLTDGASWERICEVSVVPWRLYLLGREHVDWNRELPAQCGVPWTRLRSQPAISRAPDDEPLLHRLGVG